MSEPIVFALPGNEAMATDLAALLNGAVGESVIRRFPDGETFVKIVAPGSGRDVILVCTLDRPDEKLMPLYFACKTLREFGATRITLVAPYLAYMRQDMRFNEGECITSVYFAEFISSFVDQLITVDPHLHRRESLSEIYKVPTLALHAAPLISAWIRDHVQNALLVGPDMESAQWVSAVAKEAGAPFIVLEKKRHGDSDVEVLVPDVSEWKDHTPVLVDDIISTARTMIETAGHLNKYGYKPAVCIGVHGIFANNAYAELLGSGVGRVVTTNAIAHATNCISVTGLIAGSL